MTDIPLRAQIADVVYEAARDRMRQGTVTPKGERLADGINLRAATEAGVDALLDAGLIVPTGLRDAVRTVLEVFDFDRLGMGTSIREQAENLAANSARGDDARGDFLTALHLLAAFDVAPRGSLPVNEEPE